MIDTVLIRPMTSDDVEACAHIMAENALWQRYGVTIQSAQQRLGQAVAEEETLFVAELALAVVGFVWCVSRGAFARSGYIPLIGVAPDMVGHGVGVKLLKAAEAYLGQASPDIFLTVSDFNKGAQRFYQRQGYKQVGALPDYVLKGVTELIFWKRLQSSVPQPGVEDVSQAIAKEVEPQHGQHNGQPGENSQPGG